MGTYTTNYNLYMPSIGEQGWGDLMNGNLTTIDTTMKSFNTRVGTLETEVSALEGVSNGGNIISKSITNSGNITSTGIIYANGGILGRLYLNGELTTTHNENTGEITYATCTTQTASFSHQAENSWTTYKSPIYTVSGYNILIADTNFPLKMSPGIYIRQRSDITGTVPTNVTRTLTWTCGARCNGNICSTAGLYINGELKVNLEGNNKATRTFTVQEGDTFQFQVGSCYTASSSSSVSISALPTYYINAT